MNTIFVSINLCLILVNSQPLDSPSFLLSEPMLSYEEFLEPSIGRTLPFNDPTIGLLPVVRPPVIQVGSVVAGGDYGEDGCSHLNAMKCDGKLETMIEKTNWMLYMASPITGTIDLDTVACVDRCVQDYCKAVKTKFTYTGQGSYTQDLWGTDGKYLIYLRQTILVESEKLYIFKSEVKDIEKAGSNDKDTIPVEKHDSLTQILQASSFVILGGVFDKFIVFETCSRYHPVVFVYLCEDIYLQNDEQKESTLHDINVILYNNKIDSGNLKFFKDRFRNTAPTSAMLPIRGGLRNPGMDYGLHQIVLH